MVGHIAFPLLAAVAVLTLSLGVWVARPATAQGIQLMPAEKAPAKAPVADPVVGRVNGEAVLRSGRDGHHTAQQPGHGSLAKLVRAPCEHMTILRQSQGVGPASGDRDDSRQVFGNGALPL